MKRISLDAKQFYELVRGRVVTVDDVEIAFQDIGFAYMLHMIKEAIRKRVS